MWKRYNTNHDNFSNWESRMEAEVAAEILKSMKYHIDTAPISPVFGEDPVFIIDRIVGHKTIHGKVVYRVHWKEYDDDSDTWEPESEFMKQHGGRIAIAFYRRWLWRRNKYILPLSHANATLVNHSVVEYENA
jgi:hypothetical protein